MSSRLPLFGDPYAPRRTPVWRTAATWSLGFVALLWLIEAFDTATGGQLDDEGVQAGTADGLAGVLFAPLLHFGWGHLLGNTAPLLVLGFLILLSGVGHWVAVTATVWVVGGLGAWFFGGPGTVHAGASTLIFGWLTYLIVRGIFTRHVGQIVLGVVVFLVYGGLLWGVLPGRVGISWQLHLFGALGGVLAAWWLAPHERARRTSRGY